MFGSSLRRTSLVFSLVAFAVLVPTLVCVTWLGPQHLKQLGAALHTSASQPVAKAAPASDDIAYTVLVADWRRLQQENSVLHKALQSLQQAGQPPTGLSDTDGGRGGRHDGPRRLAVDIDLVQLLGKRNVASGVTHDPLFCYPPWEKSFPQSTQQQRLEAVSRLTQDLVAELAAVLGVAPQAVNASLEFDEQVAAHRQRPRGGQYPRSDPLLSIHHMYEDPLYHQWRQQQLRVLARYMVFETREIPVKCDLRPEPVPDAITTSLGIKGCYQDMPPRVLAETMGYMLRPFASPESMAREVGLGPTCTVRIANHATSWASWLLQERLQSREWRTYDTFPEEDKLLLLFDLRYELSHAYTRQHWLGAVAMQNPFDLMAIQDIIYTVKPDLIIETGTANGGSALLWASLQELCGVTSGRVITMDFNEPSWEVGKEGWGGKPRTNPTEHPLWKKHVTFIKGSSTSPANVERVRKEASLARSVLVLLDSGHHATHVAEEMEAYCRLVTNQAYCIVEDMRLSRWSNEGPVPAVKDFLAKHPEFRVDRQREPFYTHHASGYLQRISPA